MSLAGKDTGRPTGRGWKQIAPERIVLDETERSRSVEDEIGLAIDSEVARKRAS
jgi:hypothetical protein